MMYRLKGLIYGVISSATFGLIPLFALPAIRNGIGVDSVMFYRFGISALVLGLWLVIRRYDLRISGRELFTLAGLGIFYAMTALLLTTSYLYIPSGIATTIHFLYPVVVTTVMILFFKDKVSVPVIGNGDITDCASAAAILKQTGCDGIMIGRAARGNPFIFGQIASFLETGKLPDKPSLTLLRDTILRHADLQVKYKGEYTAVREMRKHIAWYSAGLKNSARLRGEINEIESMEELRERVMQLFSPA